MSTPSLNPSSATMFGNLQAPCRGATTTPLAALCHSSEKRQQTPPVVRSAVLRREVQHG